MLKKPVWIVVCTIVCVMLATLYVHNAQASVTSPPSLESEVFVGVGNGFGSTGTHVRRFGSVFVSTGTAITYADDATYGASFTINQAGIYAINYTDWRHDTGDGFYITSDDGPAATASYSNLDNMCLTSTSPSQISNCATTIELDAGDVIRPYWIFGGFGAQCCSADPAARFVITRIR